jgi:hypothetical protein
MRREPGTIFEPSSLPAELQHPVLNGQRSFLVRLDDQLSLNNRSRCADRAGAGRTQVLAAGGHPSAASDQTKDATNVLGTWSRVMQGGNRILEIKGGYNGFHWTNAPQDVMMGTPETRPASRSARQLPQTLNRSNWTDRADFSIQRKTRLKIGAE